MIDHVTIAVRDVEVSKHFYQQAFAPLAYKVAFGKEGVFWAFNVGEGTLFEIRRAGENEAVASCHVAFRVQDEAQVQEFHRAALAAGGRNNGEAGLRPEYTDHYYACFVHDPDGHYIEAMYDSGKA